MYRFHFTLAVMLLMLLAACSGRESAQHSATTLPEFREAPAGWLAQLPTLPPERGSSGSSVSERVGSNYLQKSSNAIEDGNFLDLLSGDSSLAWAYWQYTGMPRVVTELEFVANIDAGNEYWIAVADYGSGRWQFRGPFTSSAVLQADDIGFYSRDGDFYALALTAGGMKARIAAVNVTTDDNWNSIELRDELAVNSEPFVAMVDEKPVVLWYDHDSDAYRILRSSTRHGDSPEDWTESIFLFIGDKFVRYTDLAIVNGKPAITFSDGDNHDLNYYREGMTDYIVLSGDLNASGGRSSLLEVEGHAAIAYRDGSGGQNSNGALVYMRSATPNGQLVGDWDNRVDAYGANSGFNSPDMAIVNGHPAIACVDYLFENVMYCWTTDSDGMTAENWENRTLHLTNGDPSYINLAVVDGVPAIAFKDDGGNDEELWYVHATVPDPLDSSGHPEHWVDPFVIDTTGDAGDGTSMTTINGRPFISYLENGSGTDLLYALPTTQRGEMDTWFKGLVEETIGSSTLYTKALEIDGRLIICILEYNGSDIRRLRWFWREAGGLE